MDDETDETLFSPTETEADRIAADVLALIEVLSGRIPGLEAPHPSSSGNVRGARTVSREAIISMIGIVETFPELQRTFDVDAAHEMLQFNHAFRPVVRALQRIAANLSYTMERKKADVVFSLMQTYTIAKGLARDPNNARLLTFLDIFAREIPRGPKRKRGDRPAEES